MKKTPREKNEKIISDTIHPKEGENIFLEKPEDKKQNKGYLSIFLLKTASDIAGMYTASKKMSKRKLQEITTTISNGEATVVAQFITDISEEVLVGEGMRSLTINAWTSAPEKQVRISAKLYICNIDGSEKVLQRVLNTSGFLTKLATNYIIEAHGPSITIPSTKRVIIKIMAEKNDTTQPNPTVTIGLENNTYTRIDIPMQLTGNIQQAAENAKQSTGNIQQAAENVNQATENKSQSAENKNQATENKSQSAENVNQAAENKSQSAENKNQSAENVNQSAGNKNQSAGNKNQSAGNKSQAAGNVNQSEGNINQAAENEKQQRENKKQAAENEKQQKENEKQARENEKQARENTKQKTVERMSKQYRRYLFGIGGFCGLALAISIRTLMSRNSANTINIEYIGGSTSGNNAIQTFDQMEIIAHQKDNFSHKSGNSYASSGDNLAITYDNMFHTLDNAYHNATTIHEKIQGAQKIIEIIDLENTQFAQTTFINDALDKTRRQLEDKFTQLLSGK